MADATGIPAEQESKPYQLPVVKGVHRGDSRKSVIITLDPRPNAIPLAAHPIPTKPEPAPISKILELGFDSRSRRSTGGRNTGRRSV